MSISTGIPTEISRLVGRTSSATFAAIHLYVSDATGSDLNDGSVASPLATIAAAEALIPTEVRHEVVITVQPHGGAGYAWPTFRARVFSGIGVGIYVIFPEVSVVSSGDTAQSGSTDELLRTTGSLSVGALDGLTIEILSGAAQGDRRTIRNNDATDIYPCAEFTAAVVAGDSFRIIEPDSGNILLPSNLVPMVQGTGMANTVGPMEQPVPGTASEHIPGVTIVNAIITVSPALITVADARLTLLGCSIAVSVLYGRGQLQLGKHAWDNVRPPSTETSLSISSWVGWGVHFTNGVIFYSASPYISGYLVMDGTLTARSGRYDLNGHIKGSLLLQGTNASVDRDTVRISFGKAAPFTNTPQQNPGWISANSDVSAAADLSGNTYLEMHDETQLTNLGTAPIIRAIRGAKILCQLQIILAGTNGGDGIVVESGAHMLLSNLDAHTSIDLQGTVAGQLFSIGPRSIDATMAGDLNLVGDFVSGARAFWATGLVVTTHVVTLTTIGAVVAVEATTATSAGPKLIQNSAIPGAGAVQVTYSVTGLATLTFNTTDAVTEADVYIQPEDDGTLVLAI